MVKNTLTTYEIAQYAQVTPRTVIQWINEGKLKAYRTPGNHSRVQNEDFLEFLQKYKMPVPSELVPKTSRKRVLIVDDDRGVVDSIYRILNMERIYELETAYDGFEAGEKFSNFKPDLIVLDIKMPGMDGYEVCARIRKNQKNTDVKILLISGNFDPKAAGRVKEAGANDFLDKPFNIQEFKMKVASLLGFNRREEDKG